jgi:uncharacterized metal-binding protein YceD (DUF177 family)
MLSSRIEMGELADLVARTASRTLRVNPLDFSRLARLVVRGGDNRGGDPSIDAGIDEGNYEGPSLTAEIGFEDGPERLPRVRLKISGSLDLECQRCLQAFECPIEVDTVLTVVSDEEQIDQIEDPFDSILVNADGLNIAGVIEDEVLAALPIAPVHGPGSDCADSGEAGVETPIDSVRTNRPFEGLGALIGRSEKDRSG